MYGIAMAALIGLLKVVEYKYFVRDIPLEFYVGIIALLFTALGIWAGLRLTRPKVVEVLVDGPFERDEEALKRQGISKREFEVLELIAAGLSTFLVSGYAGKLLRSSGMLLKLWRLALPVWAWLRERRRSS